MAGRHSRTRRWLAIVALAAAASLSFLLALARRAHDPQPLERKQPRKEEHSSSIPGPELHLVRGVSIASNLSHDDQQAAPHKHPTLKRPPHAWRRRLSATELLHRASNDLAELNVVSETLAARATQHSLAGDKSDAANDANTDRELGDGSRELDEIAFDRAMQLLCVGANASASSGGCSTTGSLVPPKAVWPPTTISPQALCTSGVFAVRLDCKYVESYNRVFDASGWVDTAFVVHVDETREGSA